MKDVNGRTRLSASDLANHLGCRHLTRLEQQVSRGQLDRPSWKDPMLEILQARGLEHEKEYLERLREIGLHAVTLDQDEDTSTAFEATCRAMRSGSDVIVQATLQTDGWLGRADILRRVERPSDLGEWSYEVYDTKLARETRAGTILQLCLYSEIVGAVQGRVPERMHVVSPGKDFVPESFRVDDFLAYYRLVKKHLREFVDVSAGSCCDRTYPEPVEQCDICRWWKSCDQRRRKDDHLSLVARITRQQRRELADWDVRTLEALAAVPLPLERRPSRGAPESYIRVREQARVQLEGRQSGKPVHEVLPLEPELGLARLPSPSPGDIFFDVEGDPFAGEGGLEYLLGWVTETDSSETRYQALWSFDREGERAAFVAFIDMVMERLERFPELHIYHFTAYDRAALKRLMGRYATREEELDSLLRGKVFVDLHAIVRQSIRASVERYSIKSLEPFYGLQREVPLPEASLHLRALERALEIGQPGDIPDEAKHAVEAYNRDDCVSTLWLRKWLEEIRDAELAAGNPLKRPLPGDGEPSEAGKEKGARIEALVQRLTSDVPDEVGARTEEQQARWLLACMLEWHRREDKGVWWEFFRMQQLAEEELLDEKAALSGLEFLKRVGGTDRCPIHRYGYPRQDTDIRDGADAYTTDGEKLGEIETLDIAARTVDVKKTQRTAAVHPAAVFAHFLPPAKVLAESLFRLGEWVADRSVDDAGAHRAARDLLLRRRPRGNDAAPANLRQPGEDTVAAARRLVLGLDRGVLPIQGPPGAGKTFTGARMICELVRAGKRVGVTAVSHKVIRNLLDKTVEAAREEGLDLSCIRKVGEDPDDSEPAIREVHGSKANDEVRDALESGEVQVAGGTAWLWAREPSLEMVDVLFVDEAGQMSLANVLAAAQGAKALVLLGDPQQLEQPQQGSHPDGAEVSALEHLLAGSQTLADDRGLFLAETWRLHPSICEFTSELFYEGRLKSRPELERQALKGPAPLQGAGLWSVPVEHDGCRNACLEEVDRVETIVQSLTSGTSTWTDQKGVEHPLTAEDILIVAPYNAQVSDLSIRLPGFRVGTVDRFQGQEAPVVIFSMTTSSPEEAPRGMEFLYSLHRLNVATSRARCACILVASPRLLEPECRSPRQMRLANAFCRYVETAQWVGS